MTPTLNNSVPYEARVLATLKELNIPDSYLTERRRTLHPECDDLVSIGPDMFGREQRLERHAVTQWQSMVAAAQQDGIVLVPVSGFRSFDYQRGIIERKLAAGQTIEEILRVSALPGFSEHHTGRAIDIGTPGSQPLTASFEQTPAFDWLTRRAHEFEFRMSYPRGNPFGVVWSCLRTVALVVFVAQIFRSAGSGDFPIASFKKRTQDRNVPLTRTQKYLRYEDGSILSASSAVSFLPEKSFVKSATTFFRRRPKSSLGVIQQREPHDLCAALECGLVGVLGLV